VTAFRTPARIAAALAAAAGLFIGGAGVATAMTRAPMESAPAAKPTEVPIHKNTFSPATLSVTVGQRVTWENQDDSPHTVTTLAAPEKFDSGVFPKGKTFTYTFTKPGIYKYYCAVHPDMVGTVTVTGEPTPGHSHGRNTLTTTAASPDPVSGALDPFVAHLQTAHLSRPAGAQVQDIAQFDTWTKTHQALFRMMLEGEVGPSSTLGTSPMTDVFMKHMDSAHWNRSPMGQASDIAEFDSWNKSHLAMFRMMFDPLVGKSSTLGSSPGTSVFMQHMDAAHWNQSLNAQAAAISDDPSAWASSHQAMFQAMASSLTSGGPGH